MPIVPGFAGRVHPCGAVSVGAVPPKQKTAEERRAQASAQAIDRRRKYTPDGTSSEDCLARAIQGGFISVAEGVEALSSLGLSSLPNSRNSQESGSHQAETPHPSGREKPIKIYGQKGITGMGRLRVRDGATIMERKYGKRSLTFATVTLPAMPDETLVLLCESWGDYVNRLVEEIKRELARKNAPTEIIYCTEIQEKRYQTYGQVAPHLHLLWYAYERDSETLEPTGNYAITADFLRELNQRIIYRVTGNQDISTGASVDTQKVKKSAANYLGKYMSKGGKVVNQIIEDGKKMLLPRSWWGVTKELRSQIIIAIKKVENHLAHNLFYHAEKLQKMGILSRCGKVVVNRVYVDKTTGKQIDADITYGIYGQLSPKLMHQNDLLMVILDMCDIITDDCIDDISAWISAMSDAEMVNDVKDILLSLKEILPPKIFEWEMVGMATGEVVKCKELRVA